ncbi:MAG: hypothetical protein HUU01_14465 [Saprospiraceae bacterium]|nr:hypothetical protein [Saprospiraceae bacterium]
MRTYFLILTRQFFFKMQISCFLWLSFCTSGCTFLNKDKNLHIQINGPVNNLDEVVYYKDFFWYNMALENKTDSAIYIHTFSHARNQFHPYATASFWSIDSLNTTLLDAVSDTFISLSPKDKKSFYFALHNAPRNNLDSLILYFHYYLDTTLYRQQRLEVKCIVRDSLRLEVVNSAHYDNSWE